VEFILPHGAFTCLDPPTYERLFGSIRSAKCADAVDAIWKSRWMISLGDGGT
jgi:hypothetical protein